MPDTTRVDLSKYRYQKAIEMLESAKRELASNSYATANNRAYYCIFHSMRAVLAMDGEDYKKHSAVISRFMQNYVKTSIISREFGGLIANASLIRNRSDYEDFYVCSVNDTKLLISGAESFLDCIEQYLKLRYTAEDTSKV